MTAVRIHRTEVDVVTDEGAELNLPRGRNEPCEETARKIRRVIQVDDLRCEE